MTVPSEPEKYSIDDMMDRLKSRSSEGSIEDGELVTRSDGSQAIKVRRRKRRSHQPIKEEKRIARRARILQVSGAVILLMLAFLAAGAAMVYANSAPFRASLLAKITGSSGAAAEFRQFRMNPANANANLIFLKWPQGNVLAELNVRGVQAEIRPVSFLGKAMTGEEVKGSQANLFLRVPDTSAPASEPSTENPGTVHFKRYTASKLDIVCGDPSAPLFRVFETEAALEPESLGGRPQLLLNRGHLALPTWSQLNIDRSHIEFRGSDIDIISLRFRNEGDLRGRFEFSGTVSPYVQDKPSTLAVELEAFTIAGIGGPHLGKLFSGRIDTVSSSKSNFLSFLPTASPKANMTISFRSTVGEPLEVSGFPFLIGLSRILDDDWFERPIFEADSSGTLRRANGNITLGDLNLESKGRLALRGTLAQTQGGSLAGKFEVGLADAMIQSADTRRRLDAMFGPPKDGFRWMEITISGSATSPVDDFKRQYEEAATQSSQENF